MTHSAKGSATRSVTRSLTAPPRGTRRRSSRARLSLEELVAEKAHGLERVALALEYHKANRRWIHDEEAGLDVGLPRTRSFVGSLSVGAFTRELVLLLAEPRPGPANARVDLTAKYELPEDNARDKKGLVASLTYTQKISDSFSLPISFVYSDHESELLSVQKRFSTRFGLLYKLPGK